MLLLLFGLISVLILAYHYSVKFSHHSRLPALISPVPFVGCALRFKWDPVSFLRKISEANPRGATLNMMGTKIVIFWHHDDIKHFFSSPHLDSSSALSYFGFFETLGSFNAIEGGALHANLLRKVFKVEEFAQSFSANVPDLTRTGDGDFVEIYEWTRKAVMQAAITTLFGKKIKKELGEDFFQWQISSEKAVEKCLVLGRRIGGFWTKSVGERRKALAEYMEEHAEGPYVDLLEQELKDKSLVGEACVGLLTAAPKNVSITVANCIVFLHLNPKYMAQALVEISKNPVNEGQDLLEWAENLEVLARCINETMRLTCLPFGGIRMVTSDQYRKFPIGTLVTVSHLARARDKEAWQFPSEFRPFRAEAKHALDFIPFGGGRHLCPGRKYAMMMMFLVLHKTLPALSCAISGSVPPLEFGGPTFALRSEVYCKVKDGKNKDV